MTTAEGDINIFLMAVFLSLTVVVLPLVSIVIMHYLTNQRDRRLSRWEGDLPQYGREINERKRHGVR